MKPVQCMRGVLRRKSTNVVEKAHISLRSAIGPSGGQTAEKWVSAEAGTLPGDRAESAAEAPPHNTTEADLSPESRVVPLHQDAAPHPQQAIGEAAGTHSTPQSPVAAGVLRELPSSGDAWRFASSTSKRLLDPHEMLRALPSFELQEDKVCFAGDGAERVGCRARCPCRWFEQCYPKRVLWESDVAHQVIVQSVDVGSCNLAMTALFVISAAAFLIVLALITGVRIVLSILEYSSLEKAKETLVKKAPARTNKNLAATLSARLGDSQPALASPSSRDRIKRGQTKPGLQLP